MRLAAAILAVFLPGAMVWLAGPPAIGRAMVQAIGQTLLALGYPSAAAPFFDDPAWQGVALYSAGRWREAAEAFGTSPPQAYNRGNALARAGRYAEALAAYDAALEADPDNEDAAFNRALVAALAGAQEEQGANTLSHPVRPDVTRRLHGDGLPHGDVQTGDVGSGSGGDRETLSRPGAHGGDSAAKYSKANADSSDSSSGREAGLAAPGGGAGRASGAGADVAKLIAERNRRSERRMERRSVQPSEAWLQTLPDDPGRFLKLKLRAEQARRKEMSLAGEGE